MCVRSKAGVFHFFFFFQKNVKNRHPYNPDKKFIPINKTSPTARYRVPRVRIRTLSEPYQFDIHPDHLWSSLKKKKNNKTIIKVLGDLSVRSPTVFGADCVPVLYCIRCKRGINDFRKNCLFFFNPIQLENHRLQENTVFDPPGN